MSLLARSRRCLSAATLVVALVASVCVFVGFSHGLLHEPMPEGHYGPAQEAAAVCLVLFTVLTPLALAVARVARRFSQSFRAPARGGIVLEVAGPHPPDGDGARASPAWLQRFLT